jgi:DNA-binding CsgD family transcriptional regulator
MSLYYAILNKLAAQGMLDKEIAERLGISQHTVNIYWRRIYNKTCVHKRKTLLAEAARKPVT